MRGLLLRFWIVLAVAAAIGLSVWSMRFFGRYQPLADLMNGASRFGQVGLEVQNAQVTGRVAGRRRWEVSAHVITFSRDQRQVAADGVNHGRFYDAAGHALVALAAGGAVYQSPTPVFGAEPQGFLQVSGGIRAQILRAYGPTITSTGLTWNPVTDIVQSQGPVTAQFPARAGALIGGARMAADGVQWDTRGDSIQSSGQVQVAFARNVGSANGAGVQVDLHSGNMSLQALRGTFNLSPTVQTNMATRPLHPWAALAGVALTAAPLGAAPLVDAPLATAAPVPHAVTYAAGASLWLNAQHQAQFSHGVTIQQDDETLQTDAAIVNLDDQQQALNAESRAPVHLWDTQNDLTGQHGTIDFQTHIATIKDNITVLVKPGAQEKNAPKTSLHSRFTDPATMTCQLMTYDYHRKIGTVPGPLTIHQKDRVLTADSGTYDARKQIVYLVGHVHGHTSDGVVDSPEATIGVREGQEFLILSQPSHGFLNPKANKSDTADDSSAPVDDPQGYDDILKNGPAAPSADSGTAAPSAPTDGAPAAPTAPTSPPAEPPAPTAPAVAPVPAPTGRTGTSGP